MNGRIAHVILGLAASALLSSSAPGWGGTPDTEAYYGELHLHTALSTDAWMNGTRKHPSTSYRFAQGDPITLSNGAEWALSRPLDFVAITDHAESFGDLALCKQPDSPVYDKPLCRAMRGGNDPEMMGRVIGGWTVEGAKRNPVTCGDDGKLCIEAAKNTWQSLRDAADRADRPGEFTALVAYEYSPVMIGPGGASKVHRNVIFRTGAAPDRAFSSYDGTIEDLHAWLDQECAEPCRAITIPHNSNASSSQIFWEGRNSDGSPWSQEILERRARLEPLVEIYQGKGSSECHPGLGLTDEECGFEQWVKNCEEGERLGFVNEVVEPSELLAAARRWADLIVECAPLSVRATKQATMDGLRHGLIEDAMAERYPAIGELFKSEDFVGGPLAFAEKRPPNWKGR